MIMPPPPRRKFQIEEVIWNMKNQKIRWAASSKGVKHWRIAAALGIHETTLTRKLRTELSAQEREYILSVIDELSEEEC